jgi:hypothetical protein
MLEFALLRALDEMVGEACGQAPVRGLGGGRHLRRSRLAR